MAGDEDQLYVFHPPSTLALPLYPGEGLTGEGGEGEVLPLDDAEQQNGEETNVTEDGTIMSMCVCVRVCATVREVSIDSSCSSIQLLAGGRGQCHRCRELRWCRTRLQRLALQWGTH